MPHHFELGAYIPVVTTLHPTRKRIQSCTSPLRTAITPFHITSDQTACPASNQLLPQVCTNSTISQKTAGPRPPCRPAACCCRCRCRSTGIYRNDASSCCSWPSSPVLVTPYPRHVPPTASNGSHHIAIGAVKRAHPFLPRCH